MIKEILMWAFLQVLHCLVAPGKREKKIKEKRIEEGKGRENKWKDKNFFFTLIPL